MSARAVDRLLHLGRPIVTDGGNGTEVLRRGVRWRQHGIEDAPDVIRQIHSDYIAAGADVICSHTFNLTRHNFINFFRDAEHMAEIGAPDLATKAKVLCQKAVALAQEARAASGREQSVAIAGAISTVNHPFRPDLVPETSACFEHHGECAEILKEAGVDLIFLEGMNTIREMKAAIAAAKATDLPVWVSLIVGPGSMLLSGEDLKEAASLARDGGADAIFVSGATPEMISHALPAILNGGPIGARAFSGRYSPPSWKPDFYPRFVDPSFSPAAYAAEVRQWIAAGASIVGGSSGTTPDHIRAVREAIA